MSGYPASLNRKARYLLSSLSFPKTRNLRFQDQIEPFRLSFTRLTFGKIFGHHEVTDFRLQAELLSRPDITNETCLISIGNPYMLFS